MHIKKNIFAKRVAFLGFFLLATLSSTQAAITVISDKSTFDTARSNGEWNGRLRMASSEQEFGIANGGTIAPLTNDYENWRQYGASPIVAETLTMSFTIVATSTSITMSFGDVISSTHGTFAGSASANLTNALGIGPYTTLWIGLESKLPDNSFSIINASLNGDGISDITANNVSFAGIYAPVGSSWTLTGDFQTIHPEGPGIYSLSDAGFYMFGDNTAAAVPEPSSVFLLILSGFVCVLRRKR